MSCKICFICTGNACRPPFAECVMKKLMAADAVIVFDGHHRDAVTRVLDYSHWNRIVLFNKIALDEDGNVEGPHYQTATGYRNVAKHIENGCKRLTGRWKPQQSMPEC